MRARRIRPEPETSRPEMKPLWKEVEDARRAASDKWRAEHPVPAWIEWERNAKLTGPQPAPEPKPEESAPATD